MEDAKSLGLELEQHKDNKEDKIMLKDESRG
jgi:hypothetical protein